MTVFLRCGECDYFPEMLEECVRSGCGKMTSLPWVRTRVPKAPAWLPSCPPPGVWVCPVCCESRVWVTFPDRTWAGSRSPLARVQRVQVEPIAPSCSQGINQVGFGPVASGQRCLLLLLLRKSKKKREGWYSNNHSP